MVILAMLPRFWCSDCLYDSVPDRALRSAISPTQQPAPNPQEHWDLTTCNGDRRRHRDDLSGGLA